VKEGTVVEQSGFQVSGGAAERYERYAVQYFIGPWAPGLVASAALRPAERVLDLACGTGVVARIAAAKVGEAGHVTGLDINAGMLAVARSLPTPSGPSITWVEGSATAMDLPDASFDVVVCQQGLQFFPDKSAALREIRRVLGPGGRALLSVWKSMGPYPVAVGNALERCVGLETATKFRASRVGLPDEDALRRMLTEAGFRDVRIRPSAMVVQLPSIEKFVLGHLSGTPVAGAVAALDDEERAALAGLVKMALQPYANGDGVAVPDEINIAIAHQ
jgi:ubiquinone/menaquinone biosynthesis C-methylase UbiE